MKFSYWYISLLLVFVVVVKLCDRQTDHPSGNYQLVWSDEFNYEGLPDSTKWTYDIEGNPYGWGNRESQFYTVARTKNVWVSGGVLKIIAHKEAFDGKEYTSARLNSSVAWHCGRIDVRARIPDGRGTWAAIWMMPEGWSFNNGNWPDVGEIDIMEHVGHDLGKIHGSAHSKDYQWQKGTQKTGTTIVTDCNTQFHIYTLVWTTEELKCYVDDQLYFNYLNEQLGETKWPYDKPFYLILNLAVGGLWGRVNGIDDSAFPQFFEIDYVRVYKKSK